MRIDPNQRWPSWPVGSALRDAGRQRGQAIGETGEIGYLATQFKDLHHTILGALGMVPEDLSFEHNGRPERLTGVAGSSRIIPGVLG